MRFGQALNRIRLRIASPQAEVALAAAGTLAVGSALLALAGHGAAAGMLWIAAFYGAIAVSSIVQRLRHIAFAHQLSHASVSFRRESPRRSSGPVRNDHVGIAA